jgi:hypothetical protein
MQSFILPCYNGNCLLNLDSALQNLSGALQTLDGHHGRLQNLDGRHGRLQNLDGGLQNLDGALQNLYGLHGRLQNLDTGLQNLFRSDPVSIMDTLKRRRITVLGSLNYDVFLKIDQLPILGETMAADDDVVKAFGGKGANQAIGCAKLIDGS